MQHVRRPQKYLWATTDLYQWWATISTKLLDNRYLWIVYCGESIYQSLYLSMLSTSL